MLVRTIFPDECCLAIHREIYVETPLVDAVLLIA